MKPEPKSIFREKARQLYLQHKQKLVVLRLVQPKLFPYFWVFLALLLVLAFLAWNTQVPVLYSGLGLVLEEAGGGRMKILALLPPETQARIAPGQQLTVRGRGKHQAPLLVLEIQSVEPGILSPDAIRRNFSLDPALGGQIEGPAVVALSPIDTAAQQRTDFHRYLGSAMSIEVQVGTRRVLGLAPGLRTLMGEG